MASAPASGSRAIWISPLCPTSIRPRSRNLFPWPAPSGNKTGACAVSFSEIRKDEAAMTEPTNRRDALKCLGVGAGTLFSLQGGVFSAFDLAEAREDMGTPLFLQISDTHIGFNKDANPDVVGTLNSTIDAVNALPRQPALVLHTGD